MKMTRADYKELYDALDDFVATHGAEKLREYRNNLSADARVKNLDVRFCWDVLYASRFPITDLYHYLNDAHITTALRAWVRAFNQSDVRTSEKGEN